MRTAASLIAIGLLLWFWPQTASATAAGATAAAQERTAAPRPGARRVAKPVIKRPVAARPAGQRTAGKRRTARRASPYGFLPGYRPPEVIERRRRWRAAYGPYYALPWARFYRGRWNGGGFGPCYTYTPIGPIWNCGR